VPLTPEGSAAQRDTLFIQSTTEFGGAESVLYNLLEHSPALRARSLVASLSFGNGNLPERLRGLDLLRLNPLEAHAELQALQALLDRPGGG